MVALNRIQVQEEVQCFYEELNIEVPVTHLTTINKCELVAASLALYQIIIHRKHEEMNAAALYRDSLFTLLSKHEIFRLLDRTIQDYGLWVCYFY